MKQKFVGTVYQWIIKEVIVFSYFFTFYFAKEVKAFIFARTIRETISLFNFVLKKDVLKNSGNGRRFSLKPFRRGGWVAETTSLLNWRTGNCTGGSNPPLSAQEFYSGYSTVRLVYLVWDQGVAGSNPATPTKNTSKLKACKSDDLQAFLFFPILIPYNLFDLNFFWIL